jgi:hypothetical protein
LKAAAMPDGLRARIAVALTTTPARFLADAGHAYPTRHGEGRGGHDYDGGCALCRREVDTLLDAVMAVLEMRHEVT